MDGSGLLFLPAASGNYFYASVSSSADSRLFIRYAVMLSGASASVSFGVWRKASSAIRLASRSGLFRCLVGGIGLLFLPAAGYYWSYSASSSGMGAFCVVIRSSAMNQGYSVGRVNRYIIRLASR